MVHDGQEGAEPLAAAVDHETQERASIIVVGKELCASERHCARANRRSRDLLTQQSYQWLNFMLTDDERSRQADVRGFGPCWVLIPSQESSVSVTR